MSPCPKKPRPLCAWCGVMHVKLMKNECCDESCAASLRWERMKEAGKIKTFETASSQARQNEKFKRLQKEFEQLCAELEIEPTPAIRKLFVISRNRGYHNGFMTREKQLGKEKASTSRPDFTELTSDWETIGNSNGQSSET